MSKHVIVIGAGAAGLMAAKSLVENGVSVTVVEARDRIGGRIHTLKKNFSKAVEAGAEFVHGSQPLTLSLAKEVNVELSVLSGNMYSIQKGQLQDGDFFDSEWDSLNEALQKLDYEIDMASFLNKNFNDESFDNLRKRVKGFVEGYDAADLNRVSALALKEEWAGTDDEHQFHIKGGYEIILHYLADNIKRQKGIIKLSSPVHKIQWSAGKVKVILETGESLEADQAVITVPLGVLQKGGIRFTPSLPAYENAFAKLGFGGVIKFLFEFQPGFLEERINRPLHDIAFVFSDADIPTWWSQRPDKTPLLTGWLGGPSTFSVTHNPEALYEKAINSLQYIFDCSSQQLQNEIRAWHVADWVKDSYSYGAYGYATVDSQKAVAMLNEPIENTLYFAGEALYSGPAMGTVEAALASGQEVAGRVIRKYNVLY